MAKKLTLEIVKERLKEINPNIDILSDEYINNNTKLKCKCLIDGYVWNVRWSHLSQGRICPECSSTRRDYTIQDIREKLFKINPNIEILSGEYANSRVKMKCKCKIDGCEWDVNWGSLSQGRGCPKCSDNSKSLTLKEIKERLSIISPNIDILGHRYTNSTTKIRCKCRIDGYEWNVIWKSLNKGHGCPECANQRRDYTILDIREKLHKINPNIEILSKEYINSYSKLKCKCKADNHEWEVNWDNLKQGNGCPKCNLSKSKSEKAISEILLDRNIICYEQYRLEACKNKRSLPFDFALFDNDKNLLSLIEYDGEQHFKPVNFGGVTNERAFKNHQTTKQRDQIKNTYCKENNIPLLRIPYWEKDNIENILDEWLEKIGLIKGVSGNETLMS